MSLLTVIKACLSFTGKQIFNEIGFQVEPKDRVGLVGPNGSGKTTLLRLIIGDITPDSGEIRLAKRSRVGYLPQDVQETLSGPLLQSVVESVPGRVQLNNELSKADASLKNLSCKHDQIRAGENLAEITAKPSLKQHQYKCSSGCHRNNRIAFTVSERDHKCCR
ncbi:MAG: ATP-binding cassette domain-containing protein, partial [Dissulfuribacterales bacterium]